MKLLYRLTPHSRLSRNPLFVLETRRVRWGCDVDVLLRSTWRWLLLICGLILALWLLVLVGSVIGGQSRLAAENALIVVWWMLALSLLAAPALDFVSISTALGSIHGEITAGRWDLLRLTLLPNPQIVAAKHTAAQVRVWRATMLITALRTATVLIGTLNLLLLAFNDPYFMRGVSFGEWISLLVLLLTGGVTCAIYLLEPLWRMRALTALGVAISARTDHATSAALLGIGAIAVLWIAQIMLLIFLLAGLSMLFLPLGLIETSLGLAICTPVAFVALLIVVVRGFFSIIQTWSLRRAERWVARIH